MTHVGKVIQIISTPDPFGAAFPLAPKPFSPLKIAQDSCWVEPVTCQQSHRACATHNTGVFFQGHADLWGFSNSQSMIDKIPFRMREQLPGWKSAR